jgi:GntR family transcriptional regulator
MGLFVQKFDRRQVSGYNLSYNHTTRQIIMFKRSPSLTEQTKLYIKERIVNNEFADGRIPSETELANELGVSRTTVRDALGRLESEGAVIRKQGAGTFVNQQGLRIKWRLDEIWSYENVLRANGYTPSVQVRGISGAVADKQLARELELDEGDPLLVIEKVFLEDQTTPVIFTLNKIPRKFISDQAKPEQVRKPIYEFLAACCRQHLLYYLSDIVPVVVDDTLSEALDVPVGSALLSFEEIGYNTNNDPILKATSYFRDDRLRFRLIRRRT